jgi:hypothetical protein
VLPAEAGAAEARAAAVSSAKVRQAIAGRAVRDVIYVPGTTGAKSTRLANIVTGSDV